MSRIYWDTMLFIYWLEDNPKYARRVEALHSRMKTRGDQLITGSFTFGEVLAGVYRRGAADLAPDVRRELEAVVSEVVPFNLETADRYARIRGPLRLPSADAFHLASAAQAGTDLFLTNDKRLVGKFVPGIQFIASFEDELF